MVSDDRRDLGVLVDVSKDALANSGVLLHVAALLEGQRPWFLEKPRRQANLPDVMNEAAEIRLIPYLLGEAHSCSDVT